MVCDNPQVNPLCIPLRASTALASSLVMISATVRGVMIARLFARHDRIQLILCAGELVVAINEDVVQRVGVVVFLAAVSVFQMIRMLPKFADAADLEIAAYCESTNQYMPERHRWRWVALYALSILLLVILALVCHVAFAVYGRLVSIAILSGIAFWRNQFILRHFMVGSPGRTASGRGDGSPSLVER